MSLCSCELNLQQFYSCRW